MVSIGTPLFSKSTYIIGFKNSNGLTNAQDFLNLNNISSKETYKNIFKGFTAVLSTKQLNSLKSSLVNEISFISQNDKIYRIKSVVEGKKYNSNLGSWGIDRIDQKNLPLDNEYNPINKGKGSKIYIFDTGFRMDHKQWGSRASAILDSKEDAWGHGTLVGGIAAGESCCDKVLWGVAPEADIISMNVFPKNQQYTNIELILSGLEYIAGLDDKSNSVINMSLGYKQKNTALETAIKKVISLGVPVVASAGNSNDDSCDHTPAGIKEVITVGSSTKEDTIWQHSSHGKCVDIFAPGHNITGGWIDSPTSSFTASGTSEAAPHVAGAIAIYFSKNPGASAKDAEDYIKKIALKNKLKDTKGSPNLLLYVGE